MLTANEDNEISVEIHVLQGENKLVTHNKSIGRFIFDGITSAAKGISQINVALEIDHKSDLKIKVRNETTGQNFNSLANQNNG